MSCSRIKVIQYLPVVNVCLPRNRETVENPLKGQCRTIGNHSASYNSPQQGHNFERTPPIYFQNQL